MLPGKPRKDTEGGMPRQSRMFSRRGSKYILKLYPKKEYQSRRAAESLF